MLGKETALIFTINRKYIRPLKVLLYSLVEQDSLQGCDIVIVTDDMLVTQDPLFNEIAADIDYHDADSMKVFSTIRGDLIAEKSKTYFAPKYTFFKFLGMKPRGYQRHIIFDVDMLCINPLDEELLALPYSAKAVSELKGYRFPIRDEPQDRAFNIADAEDFLLARSDPMENPPAEKINSGFVVLEGSAISDNTFLRAIELSSSKPYNQEQAVTSDVIYELQSFLRLPIWYNSRRRIFESLGDASYEKNKSSIKLIHYTPGKPWAKVPGPELAVDKLWLDCEKRAKEWVEDTSSTYFSPY